jgi:DtxR family Mn-dependent transcriptional regulator
MHGLSEAIQDYLKEIYKLQHSHGRARTNDLAKALDVTPASATAFVKRLAALDLVEHELYRGVTLTPAGERVALEVIRHHRLLELYLAETLGLALDEVHAEAEKLEHVLSESLERIIDERLGFPTHDPHGDPIPNARLELESDRGRTLSALAPGERAVIRRVPDDDAAVLRLLVELDIVPGAVVSVGEGATGGQVKIIAGDREHAITRELAALIDVT